MSDQDARARAEQITAELFVNGAGQKAERLVLTDKDGRDLGGWARVVVQRRILDALSATADTARAQAFEEAATIAEAEGARLGVWFGSAIGTLFRARATSGDTPCGSPKS